jgi:hypothetical protein
MNWLKLWMWRCEVEYYLSVRRFVYQQSIYKYKLVYFVFLIFEPVFAVVTFLLQINHSSWLICLDKVVLGQVFASVLPFSPFRFIPLVLH